MPIRQRGDVYQVEVRIARDPRNGKWIKRAATFDTLDEAQRAERKMLAEAENLRAAFVAPSRQKVGDYLAEWLERKRNDGLKAKTIYDYDKAIARLITPAFRHVRLAELSPVMVQRWQDALAKRADDRGAAMAAYAHRVLRAALNDAVRLGQIAMNPAARARPAQRSRRKRQGFTLAEANALFSAAKGSRIEPLLRFALYSGLRRGEALGLQWGDLNEAAGTITVRRNRVDVGGTIVTTTPKTQQGMRTFSLPTLALDALQMQRVQQEQDAAGAGGRWNPQGWVFTTSLGTPLDPADVDRSFRAVRKRTGVRALPMYSLRHATASVLLGAGVPLGIAAKMMGHSQVATFADTYAELLQEASKDAAKQVDAFLAQASKALPLPPEPSRPRRRGRPRANQLER